MADAHEPITQACAGCGALIDVSDEEPFAMVHCPSCGKGMRVRRQFDHFELQEVLGAGGMGTVYRALDKHLSRSVALKLLRKEYNVRPDFVEQFRKEAAITASINHPHVVKVYSTGSDHGLLYITMELVDKGSLDDLMMLQGRVAEAQILDIGIQIASGLNAALAKGLIHRDIKPGNILFANAQTAKIVDFGLAVLQEEAGKIGGEVWGTPYYVAPEKLDNQPEDFRSDMYSLGATLFHALAGRPPFEAETASMVALKHVKSQPVSIQSFAPDISSATAYVINRTLNKDPDKRYSSYEEFVEHLQYARDELKKLEGTKRGRARVVIGGREEETAMSWVTFAMVAVVVIVGVVLFLNREKLSRQPEPVYQPTPVAVQSGTAVEEKYQEARAKLLAGDVATAAIEFGNILSLEKVPQPQRSWVRIHLGLAELFRGREKESREVFFEIIKEGPYSTDPGEAKLAQFFVDTAKLLSAEEKVPADLAKDYDKSNYQAFALLLFGIKNWHLTAFDDASALFRQFNSATPQPPYGWIADYKPLTEPYIEEWSTYRRIGELLNETDTAEEAEPNLAEAKKLRDELKLRTILPKKAEELVEMLAQKAAKLGEDSAKKMAELEAADAKAFDEVKTTFDAAATQFKFSEALAAAQSLKAESPKGKAQKDALVKRGEWLVSFKKRLIQDLTTSGYPHRVVKKSRGTVDGGITGAQEDRVESRTPYGAVPIAWVELPPEMIAAMAAYFAKTTLPANELGERQWLIGVYLYQCGKIREGRAMLVDASQRKPDYLDFLELFPDTSGGSAGSAP